MTAMLFVIADDQEPDFWCNEVQDGCRYAAPREWARQGFFEKWHDGDPAAIASFAETLKDRFPHVTPDLVPHRVRK